MVGKGWQGLQGLVTKIVDEYDVLTRTGDKKRGDSWKKRVRELANKISRGFDV